MPITDIPFHETFLLSFEAIGRLFLVALVGFIFVRRGLLSDIGVTNLSRLMIDVIVPCALCVPMVKGFDADSMALVWPLVMLPPIFIPMTILMCLLFFRLWRGNRPSSDRAVSALAAIPNSFYVPFPLALAVTPPEHHVTVGILLGAAVLSVNPIQWTLGTFLVVGRRDRDAVRWLDSVKHALNGPVLGVVGGVLLSFVPGFPEAARGEAGSFLPLRMLFEAMTMVGWAMGPMAMIIVGALVGSCQLRHAVSIRYLLPIMLSRFVIVPGVIWLLIVIEFLPVRGLVAFVLLLEAASPSAMNLALVARRFEGEWEILSGIQLIVNTVALVTLPFWMAIGLRM